MRAIVEPQVDQAIGEGIRRPHIACSHTRLHGAHESLTDWSNAGEAAGAVGGGQIGCGLVAQAKLIGHSLEVGKKCRGRRGAAGDGAGDGVGGGLEGAIDEVGPGPGLVQVELRGAALVGIGGDIAQGIAGGGAGAGGCYAGGGLGGVGGAGEKIAFAVAVRQPGVHKILDLVGVVLEPIGVGRQARALGQRLVALLLQHHLVPGLGANIAAQIPARRIGVEKVPAQRRCIARRQRDIVVQPGLDGELLEDARHAAPGVGLEGVGARRIGGIHGRSQVVHIGGVVAHHRVDAAEGIAVADEQHGGGHGAGRAAGDDQGREEGVG